MSNTNELPKEIWIYPVPEHVGAGYPFGIDLKHQTIDDIPYILKSFHESEMERVKGEMQKEIDLLKSGPHTFVADNILYAQKTCDCKLKLSATANFLCHGQCKY